jgi:hypothetical protein
MCLTWFEPGPIINEQIVKDDERMDGWWVNENHFFVEALVPQLGSSNGTSLVNSFFTFPSISFLIHTILAYYCGENEVSEQLFTLITYLLAFTYRLWWT